MATQGATSIYGRPLLSIPPQEGFGGCTNHRECEAACPKEISVNFIARLNRDMMKSVVVTKE